MPQLSASWPGPWVIVAYVIQRSAWTGSAFPICISLASWPSLHDMDQAFRLSSHRH